MNYPVRTAASAILILIAVVLSLLASLGGFVNHVANDPAPAREILGQLPSDPAVSELLPREIGTQLTERIPASLPLPDAFKRVLSDGIAKTTDTLLQDPGFQGAWLATIDASRAGYMEELRAVNAGTATTASLKLDIGPLADATYARVIQALDGSPLGALLPAPGTGPAVDIDTGFPAEETIKATTLAGWLALAGNWVWFAVAALLTAVISLAVAGKRSRGWVLAAGGALVLIAAGVLALWTGNWANPVEGTDDLQAAVTRVVLNGLGSQVGALAGWLAVGGGIAVVLGLGWLVLGKRGAARVGS